VEPGGLFIFDVNTPYKHRQVLDRANVENMDCLLDLTAGEVGKVHLHNIIAENIGTLCCGADVEKQ
jgi:hypothetical protein